MPALGSAPPQAIQSAERMLDAASALPSARTNFRDLSLLEPLT